MITLHPVNVNFEASLASKTRDLAQRCMLMMCVYSIRVAAHQHCQHKAHRTC